MKLQTGSRTIRHERSARRGKRDSDEGRPAISGGLGRAGCRAKMPRRSGRSGPLSKSTNQALPNQSLEPTNMLVTPRAGARVAPSTVVAHL